MVVVRLFPARRGNHDTGYASSSLGVWGSASASPQTKRVQPADWVGALVGLCSSAMIDVDAVTE